MLLTRLFNFFRGYLVITISGAYPERFLNVCKNRHILIWDVFTCSSQMIRCSISLRGFRLIRPIARKTDVHVKIIEKCGFPILLTQFKKRKWFLLGFAFCLLCMIILNQFIWKLEITGCENVSAAYVKEKLAECGLTEGAFRPYINEKKLQTKMLIKTPELAWLWVDKSGSKVTVQVKERVLPPEMYDPNAFCNLIAAKDGVIDSMIVRNGEPMVSLGDTVSKGDLLVSGLIVSDKGIPPRQIQSDGEIYARVWYEKTKAFSLFSPQKRETGRKEKKYTLHLFGWHIPLFRNAKPDFAEFSNETKEHEVSLFGHFLGIGISCTTFVEQVTEYEKLTTESIVENGAIELLAAIDETTAPNAERSHARQLFVMLPFSARVIVTLPVSRRIAS